jgi:hypothetical protein
MPDSARRDNAVFAARQAAALAAAPEPERATEIAQLRTGRAGDRLGPHAASFSQLPALAAGWLVVLGGWPTAPRFRRIGRLMGAPVPLGDDEVAARLASLPG